MRQELIAQAFAVACALHEARDINELDARRSDLLGRVHLSEHVQTVIRDCHDAAVGLDGAEGIVGCLSACVGNGIEQSAFADIGKADNA